MSIRAVDVCVVGGGPAGAAVATQLARCGRDVVLLERHAFPRPHIGESLTPGTNIVLEKIGARLPPTDVISVAMAVLAVAVVILAAAWFFFVQGPGPLVGAQ